MSKFHTLGVTCCTRGIAKHVDVTGLGNIEREKVFDIVNGAGHTNIFKSKEIYSALIRSFSFFFFDLLDSKNHQIPDEPSFTTLSHAEKLLGVVKSAKYIRHLCLVQDEVYLINAHRIVKAYRGCVVVHARKQGYCPLSAIK